jgi:uncharacterized protein (TIGR02265 family)
MRVKGAVLLARQAFVEKHFGPEAWRRVLTAMSDEDQRLLNGLVMPVSWLPFKLGERLDATIVKVLGQGQVRLFEQIGRESAEKNLGGSHKSFLVPGNPHRFMERAPELYGFYYDTGRRVYEARGQQSGTLTTYDADTFSEVDCLTVIGWYKQALAMCGARDVQVREETCRARGGEYCRYQLQWSS